jgi:hypothetical protein
VEGRLELGKIQLKHVIAAAVLMAFALFLGFITFVVVVMISDYALPPRITMPVAAFLASLAPRRLGAGLASVILGVSVTTTGFLLMAWLTASPQMRIYGPPDSLSLLFMLFLVSLGVLVGFRFVPPAASGTDQEAGGAAA